jgi:two-component system phosphate regulon sensor histidine kinase PhoR
MTASAYDLRIAYKGGSLEEIVHQNRLRNLVVSIGMFVFLTGSVIILLIAAHRARLHALQEIEFVAGVSHELRTPLAVIASVGQNLAQGVVTNKKRVSEYGELIIKEAARLGGMVDNALEYSGIQSKRRKYNKHYISADELLRNAVKECEAFAAQSGVRLETEIGSELPMLLADERALRVSLRNIIVNAVKYGKAGGWVGVSARRSHGAVSFRIADHGPGIDHDDVKRIFEPFVRVARSPHDEVQGSGLGLSIASHIVRAHGGTIKVDSDIGRGSTFIVTIPAAESFQTGV